MVTPALSGLLMLGFSCSRKRSRAARFWFAAIVTAGCFLGLHGTAHADCRTTELPKTFFYGAIAVSNSLPVGAVILGEVASFVRTRNSDF